MNGKILIVEDNHNMSTVMHDILKNEGIESVICETGQAALEKINDEVYSMALIDINLPDMNGRQILEALKKRNHFSMAYVLTGAPSMVDFSEFIDLGAVDFFAKSDISFEIVA